MSNNEGNGIKRWGGQLPYLILAVGFIAFCFGMLHQTLSLWEDRLQQRALEDMQRRFDDSLHDRDYEPKFSYAPWMLMMRIRKNWLNHHEIQEFCATYSAFLGMHMRFLQFQDNRDLLVHPAATSTRDLFREVFAAIGMAEPLFSTKSEELKSRIEDELGPGRSLAFLRQNLEEFFLIRRNGKLGIALMSLWSDGTGVVIFMEDVPATMLREFTFYRARRQALRSRSGKAIPDREIWLPPPGVRKDSMRVAFDQANRSGSTGLSFEKKQWLFLKNRQGFVDVWVDSVPDFPWVGQLRALLWILLPVTLWWAVRLIRRLFETETENLAQVLSLRSQVRFFLMAVTLLPLGSAVALALMLTTDLESNLRSKVFSSGALRLQSLYHGLEGHLTRTAQWNRGFAQMIASNPEDIGRMKQEAMRLRKMGALGNFALLDGGYKLVTGDMPILRPDIFNLMDKLCRLALRRFAPHRVLQQPGKVETIEVFLEEVATNEQLGWSEVLENPEVVQKHQLGGAAGNLFWSVFPQLATGPAFLACTIDADHLTRSYFHPRLVASETGSMFLGVHLRFFEIVASVSDREVKPLIPLLLKTDKTGLSQQAEIQAGDRKWWMVTMPETYSGYYMLGWAADADQALADLTPLRWALLAGLLATLAMVFGVYRLLVQIVLHPIGDLRSGIAAIRQRETGVRLPVRRMDEFGELAGLFNRTLSGLKELELARLVQTQLLPACIPTIPGYSLAAENLTATELSGDYYDLVLLRDGSWLAVIGDVTGHGAPAALAMAMARAVIACRSADGETDPVNFILSLNEVFFQDMKATRRFMTLLAGRLKPEQHTLELANAGHNYPLVYRAASRRIESPEMPGLPLGIRKVVARAPYEVKLEPGDTVLYYTDGYTESLLPDETQIGPEFLELALQEEVPRAADASSLLQALVRRLDAVRRPGPRDDDVTLLVLQRLKA